MFEVEGWWLSVCLCDNFDVILYVVEDFVCIEIFVFFIDYLLQWCFFEDFCGFLKFLLLGMNLVIQVELLELVEIECNLLRYIVKE